MRVNSDSEDDLPIADLIKKKNFNSVYSWSDIDEYFPICDILLCNNDVYSACDICNCALCKDHALVSCDNGHILLDIGNLITEEVCLESQTYKQNDRPVGYKTSLPLNNADSPKPMNPREDQQVNSCEIGVCKEEVFAACNKCLRYLCYDHLDKSMCNNDHKIESAAKPAVSNRPIQNVKTVKSNVNTKNKIHPEPETFEVDGNPKEGASVHNKRLKLINKRKIAKEQRNKGEEYISTVTKKTVPARNKLKDRCNGEVCKKFGHKCLEILEEDRETILKDFYETGSVQLQREYISRYVKKKETKRKTSSKEESRRKYTLQYFLPNKQGDISVCKILFLNTLGISEKVIRTTMSKVKETGVLEPEKRGGRPIALKDRDLAVREAIRAHINLFPRMESHYCRSSSTREYLHPDLSLMKMVEMYNSLNKDKGTTTSYYTYSNEFNQMNLGFHHPKKDQCTLCNTYRGGDQTQKAVLETRYQAHIAEKNAVRQMKKYIKENLVDETCVCTCFDLQQVILLPIAADSKLFYHRRLTNYNLTVYDIRTKDCVSFLWHEGQGQRGSSEISTCIFKYLCDLDSKNVREVFLFSDGCSGQNKNSAIATMLLHVVNRSKNISSISLRFFEPYHGQNEGDSAHSAITTTLSTAGNVYVPSELKSIIRLARRKQPYLVNSLESTDFIDFMGMAKKLRILSVRNDDNGEKLNWPSMVEYMVLKKEPSKIFFKTSHIDSIYRSLTLPRNIDISPSMKPSKLYKGNNQPKLSKDKYEDLMGLCSGETPIIIGSENVQFYKNLRH